MTRLTRLSAAAQAHYVVLRSVPEISLIPFDKNIEKLFQIFSDGSRAYNTDISAFAVFTDQIHLLLTPREKRKISHALCSSSAAFTAITLMMSFPATARLAGSI